MSNLRKAAQQALEALEYENEFHKQRKENKYGSTTDAITSLRAALAQPEQEPVLHKWDADIDRVLRMSIRNSSRVVSPPQRQPLTEEEVFENDQIMETSGLSMRLVMEYVRAVEKAHGIGGHGPDCWKWGPGHYECALRKIGGEG